ncbi:MAG: FAD-dependent oxidoreductase [Methylobacteriaceae bacterium]|nr:FAD-dependent oxidoreductase [Methylobacteriaceae bacterium]
MKEVHADAVVIGAGAGGLCAAARLVHQGFHPILVEARDKVGGRATTNVIDGFIVNEGAIALEVGGVFEETFHLVGAPLDLRFPEPASAFYLDHKVVDVGKGGWGFLLGQMTKQAARILEKFAEARTGALPDGRQSTAEWLSTFTSNESVHAIFRNLCAAIFACNADELPARAFLTYFVSKGAFKRFGFCPQGTIGVWQALADAVARHGEVWLSSPAQSLQIENGAVRGVIVQHDGETVRIASDIVISNAGPKGTLALAGADAFPADYVQRVADLRSAANIVYTGIYNPNVDVTKDTTTLYASDRDVFLFLVDDLNPIEAGRLPDGSPDLYFRGFYCWNSEVGAKTLGIASFYLRAVCQNRNLWGVEDFEEITIRHSN